MHRTAYLGANDTVNVTRIISEEDTTKRCKSTDQVGLPGYGSLNSVDIASRSEDSTTSHSDGSNVTNECVVWYERARVEKGKGKKQEDRTGKWQTYKILDRQKSSHDSDDLWGFHAAPHKLADEMVEERGHRARDWGFRRGLCR